MSGIRRYVSFQAFCDSFGFSVEGDLGVTEAVSAESLATWERISVLRNTNYARQKITTIQNPTIRYFTYFLANTIFGCGDMGAMTASDLSVLHMGLHPVVQNRPNLGALLVPPSEDGALR